MSSLTRSIRRRTARRNMEKAGHIQVAKKKWNPLTKKYYTYFQDNWRNWA